MINVKLAAVIFMLVASPALAGSLLVKATRQNLPALSDAVARVGAPKTVIVPAGSKLSDEIVRQCGGLDLTYVTLTIARNPHISGWTASTVFQNDTPVELPACLRAPTAAPINVAYGSTLTQIARDAGVPFTASGLPGSPRLPISTITTSTKEPGSVLTKFTDRLEAIADVRFQANESIQSLTNGISFNSQEWRSVAAKFIASENANTFFSLNKAVAPNNLIAGASIFFPAVSPQWSLIEIASGTDPADAQKIIAQAMVQYGLKPDQNIEPALPASLIGPASESSCSEKVGPEWPVSVSQVIAQTAYNTERLNRTPTRQSILIADTGFDFFSEAQRQFPSAYMKKVRRLPAEPGGAGAVGDLEAEGINFASRDNSARTVETDKFRYHGLGVAGIALGSRAFESMRQIANIPIALSFGNVVKKGSAGGGIDPTVFPEVLSYLNAQADAPAVVNASFTVANRISGVDENLKAIGSRTILVVAAGNGGVSLASGSFWPAFFGGDPANAPSTVITVGAHGPSKEILSFSNWHPTRVDLLAPGCDMPSYSYANNKIVDTQWAGTSFSAPLVSFVAAWLRGYGLSVQEIKARILLSVDPRDDLNEKVYSRGVLNIARALGFPFNRYDIMSDSGKKTVLSADNQEAAAIQLCGVKYVLRKVAKIARDESRTDGFWHIWLKPEDPAKPHVVTRVPLCKLSAGDNLSVKVNDFVTGQAVNVDLRSLLDFTATGLPQ